MRFIHRKDIDTAKWNNSISTSTIENVFCYSWYLDAVAKNWGAIVMGDYDTIFPAPFTNQLGVKQLYQPPFSRELDVFGSDFSINEALAFAQSQFRGIQFRNRQADLSFPVEKRLHQHLKLSDPLQYNTNAKRLIKKADSLFVYEHSDKVAALIELFKETVWQKIDSISAEDLKKLIQLMNAAEDHKAGEMIAAYENGQFVGGAFFLLDKNTVTYLKGAATEDAKKNGVMFGLMNYAFERYQENYINFDFGGSDVENVANFYKKFGATDRTYYNYTIDHLPGWFKALKRVKK